MRFYANPQTRRVEDDGAISYGPGGPMDCLGNFARIENCEVKGATRRYTCYASGYADTVFSVPAYTRIRGKYVGGYFTVDDRETAEGWKRIVYFRPLDKFASRVA